MSEKLDTQQASKYLEIIATPFSLRILEAMRCQCWGPGENYILTGKRKYQKRDYIRQITDFLGVSINNLVAENSDHQLAA